jgi:PQQ-dependent catabolism-associated beta-propeller protein
MMTTTKKETSLMTIRSRPALRALRSVALFAALGAAVCSGAQARNPGQVYVSSEKDNAIYVFNAQGERQGKIDVCKRPRDMAFSPDQKHIMVVCGDSNALGLVDVATGQLTGTVPLGDSPEMFALSPDGKLAYVSIEDDNVMAAYDLASKQPVFEVATGGEPEGVLVTADGKTAYVTSEVANLVHEIDLTSKKVVKNIKVGKRPRRFALAAGGAELWVTNELDASVGVVDTKTRAPKQTIRFEVKGMRQSDITPVGIAMSPDGNTMWVGLGKANHVAEVDVATHAVKRLVLVGKRAWGLRLHPDGKTLYVANGLSDDMTLIDTASGKAVKTVPAGRVPHTVLVAK